MRSIDGRGHKSGNQVRLMRALLAGTAISAFATLPAAAQNATWSANPAPGADCNSPRYNRHRHLRHVRQDRCDILGCEYNS
jgi:hypothetical protein